MPVAFLVPVDKDIAGLENNIRGNDCFCSVLSVITRLVVNGAVVQSQCEEAFLRAARVMGKLGRLRHDGDRKRWYRFDIHEEAKESSNADVGATIHHSRRRRRGSPSHRAVDPSSNGSIGIFITFPGLESEPCGEQVTISGWERPFSSGIM